MRFRPLAARRRHAAAAVEFAILLPTILVPLTLGTWELGRIVDAQQVLDNAAREGGRQASTGQMTNSQVTTAVIQYLTNAGFKTTDSAGNVNVVVTITNLTSGLDAASAGQLDRLQIAVTLPYSNIRWSPTNYFASTTSTLSASVIWYSMRDVPLTVSASIPTQPQ